MIPETTYEPFLKALLAGHRGRCVKRIQALIDSGVQLDEIYLDLFQRTMVEVGSLWERNLISVADEHLATALMESLFPVSAPYLFQQPRNGRQIVLACVSKEQHQIGARIVSDLFEWRGWDSSFVGADTPTADLLRLIGARKPDLLGLSVSMFFNLSSMKDVLGQVRTSFPDLPILIGGRGLAHHGRELEKNFAHVVYIESGHSLLNHPVMKATA
jgi:methanogenic corrinoid protein MtbC1